MFLCTCIPTAKVKVYLHSLWCPQYESDEEEGGGAVKVKRRGRVRKPKKTSIYDVYEPSELERGYFTEKDAEIRVTDMPERFQVRKAPLQVSYSS